MALPPLFGNTKYSEFDGGDSILLGTSLLGAYNQAAARWGKAVRAYNSANPSVALALPDSNIDPETSTKTTTATLLSSKEYDAVSGNMIDVFANYVDSYTGWVVPTSGNLEGCPSLAKALFLLTHAIKRAYDLLEPNQFVADPSAFASITDNNDGAISTAVTFVVTEVFDSVTGNPNYEVYDLLTLVDDQQNV